MTLVENAGSLVGVVDIWKRRGRSYLWHWQRISNLNMPRFLVGNNLLDKVN
jgi:hypothetical protein